MISKQVSRLTERLRARLGDSRFDGRAGVLVEGAALVALILMALGVWGFVQLADVVTAGASQHFDERVLRALRSSADAREPIGPHWLKIAALDVTALGGATVLTFVILAVAGYLWIEKKHRAVALVLAAAVGGQLASTGLKLFFSRPRPDVVPRLAEVQTSSFPSGHSLMSAVVYLTLGALLTQFVQQWRSRVYVFVLACFLTVVVGMSRVFLGVHYPTDVLAGWSAGLVWALLCWLVARILQQRGQVEQPGLEPQIEGELREEIAAHSEQRPGAASRPSLSAL